MVLYKEAKQKNDTQPYQTVEQQKIQISSKLTTQLKSPSALIEHTFIVLFLTTYIQYRINTLETIPHQTGKPQGSLSWKLLFT